MKTFPSQNRTDDSQRVGENTVLHLKMQFFVLLGISAFIFRLSFVIRTASFAICSVLLLFFPKLPLIPKHVNNDLKKYKSEKIFIKYNSGRWYILFETMHQNPPSNVFLFSSLILYQQFMLTYVKALNGNADKAKTAIQRLYFDEKSRTKLPRILTNGLVQVVVLSICEQHIHHNGVVSKTSVSGKILCRCERKGAQKK